MHSVHYRIGQSSFHAVLFFLSGQIYPEVKRDQTTNKSISFFDVGISLSIKTQEFFFLSGALVDSILCNARDIS